MLRPMTTFCPLCNIPFADPFPVAPLAWRLKGRANLRKHGLCFKLAATVFSGPRSSPEVEGYSFT